MKIIFANIMLNMLRGGGENYDLNVSKELAKLGHEIEFYSLQPIFSDRQYAAPEYAKMHNVRAPWLYPLTQKLHAKTMPRAVRFLKGLPRFIGQFIFEFRVFLKLWQRRQENFIVHGCGLFMLTMLVQKFLNKKSFLRLPGPPSKALHYYCLQQVTAVIANGDVYRKVKALPLNLQNLHYINVGVDLELFKSTENKTALRQKLGLALDKKIILFVGRLAPIKNIGFLIEVFVKLKESVPETLLLLAGDGPLKASLMTKVSQLGLQQQVIFLGALNKTELADYYAAADVFALTSHYDNFPNAVIEALASGLPVVAAKVGGIDMQIESGKTGFLIAKNQPVLFQKALHKLLSQDKFRQTMSLACRQRVCQKFNWQQTAAQFIALVNKSISTKKITLHLISGLGMGGAEQMLYKIIANSRYPASQHSVISLTDRGVFAEKLRNLGCQVIVLGMRQNPIAVLSSMIKIIKKLYQLCPDTLIGWMYHGCFSASIARLFYYRKVKLIWNIRHTPGDLKTERRTTRWLIYALKVLLWLPQKIIYNAFASAEYHEQRLGYVKHKRQIIPNGFDLQHFQASQTLRHDFRQQYNIDEQTLLIGHVARFHPMKGHSILLQAFQKILVWQPDAVLVMCGRLVSSANAQLKTKLSQLGLENQVILLAEYSDLASLYPALDLLVQSSLWGEGFPNVLGEAMACEVPCVVTNVGDSGRIVDQAGYVVAPADPGALAKACIRLLSQSKESRVQLGGVGREKIAQHYTIAKVSQQFDAL